MKKRQKCLYCGIEYVAKRRMVQKFCCSSCRSLHWRDEKAKGKVSVKPDQEDDNTLPKIQEQGNKEKLSFVGMGNAAAGTAAFEIAKSLFTSQENKPATKRDIAELKSILKGRYFPVRNISKDVYGRLPYYDIETGDLVYK